MNDTPDPLPPDDRHPNAPFNNLPPGAILYPEDVSDAQLANLGGVLASAFERGWLAELQKLTAASAAAAAAQDAEATRRVFGKLKGCENWAKRWNRRFGNLATPGTLQLQEAFRDAAADIQAALGGELPGQQGDDDSEAWKRGAE